MCLFALLFWSTLHCMDQLDQALIRLQNAYPDHIQFVTHEYILWHDGTSMLLGELFETMQEKLDKPTLKDHVLQACYQIGEPLELPNEDPGRIRYEPFFKKMYGATPAEVEDNLEHVAWMPNVFGSSTYILRVTRINNVHAKIQAISDELEELVGEYPDMIKYLANPGGTYCWRVIANTNRLSAHSFGMTLDINAQESNYWQWDLKAENRQISEDELLQYRNTVPWEIVEVFEKYGFIWGGKMYHYDTMHFEYRPELFLSTNENIACSETDLSTVKP